MKLFNTAIFDRVGMKRAIQEGMPADFRSQFQALWSEIKTLSRREGQVKDEGLLAEVRALHAKVDRILALLETSKAARRVPPRPKASKPKAAPLTEDETKDLQTLLGSLFSRWLDGHELEVQEELEKLDVEQLRRFADANNLNVTAKMPKQRVLQLIGARFREKRQLQRSTFPAGEGSLPGNPY